MSARVWTEKSPAVVGARYDRIAPVYGVYEWAYGLPFVRVRRKSVEALQVGPGDTVLEVGCGTGLNFPLIEQRIGPGGTLFGIDVSFQMLSRAGRRVLRRGWSNVHLVCGDAGLCALPAAIHGALFCFSYSTMRDRTAILEQAWDRLVPGGRLVVTDARLRPGWPRRLFASLGVWMSDRTLLGKPDTDPASDLGALGGGPAEVAPIRFRPFGFEYVVCAARKPSA